VVQLVNYHRPLTVHCGKLLTVHQQTTMSTSNPKVSAYIPRSLFEKFTEFYQERELSMSQGVTAILTEYFRSPAEEKPDPLKAELEQLSSRVETIEQQLGM
jgi:hypothetical protein